MLLEELVVGGHDGKEVVSPLRCVYHGKSLFQSNIPSELNSSSKFENSSLEEGNSCEVQRLKRQVEDLKASKVEMSQEVERLILRIEEVEKEARPNWFTSSKDVINSNRLPFLCPVDSVEAMQLTCQKHQE